METLITKDRFDRLKKLPGNRLWAGKMSSHAHRKPKTRAKPFAAQKEAIEFLEEERPFPQAGCLETPPAAAVVKSGKSRGRKGNFLGPELI